MNIIDEVIGLAEISINELTLAQVREITKQFGDGSSISSLTMYYDYTNDLVVLNKDHEQYEMLSGCASGLLYAAIADAEIIHRIDSRSKSFKEMIGVLRTAVDSRKAKELRNILRKMCFEYDKKRSREQRYLDFFNDDKYVYGELMYNLGYMHGKQAERARRK